MMLRSWSTMVLVMMLLATGKLSTAQDSDPYRIIGHYSAYSVYDGYLLTEVPGDMLTHLYYGPVGISQNSQCESVDEWADTGFKYPGDDEDAREAGNFKQLALIQEKYPDLKIIMNIGGWENSVRFSEVAADENLRVRLAQSCLAYMREHNFDGINIDWRYPVAGGIEPGSEDDADNFSTLLADFRGQIEYWAERDEADYILTMSAPAVPELHTAMQPDLLQENVDWINITTYGFRGQWSDMTGHHTPLYGDPEDPRGEEAFTYFSVNGAVNAYLTYGVPAEKIVIGIGFYGQAWRNVRPGDRFGLNELNGGIPNGTRDGGLLFYRDIVQLLDNPNYIQFYDDISQAAWLYNEDRRIAISYENPESLRMKNRYIVANDLGGVFIWEVLYDSDDFWLLNTISNDLGNGQP